MNTNNNAPQRGERSSNLVNNSRKDTIFSEVSEKKVPTLDPRAFTGELEAAEPQQQTHALSDFEHLRVTLEKEYKNTQPLITWCGAAIAAAGNITAISAQAKAGKSALCNVFIAGAISQDGFCDGFTKMKIEPNTFNKAVIVMDTEQSEADQQYNIKTICKRVGTSKTPENLLCYNIRQLSINDYQQTTNTICEAAAQQFDGVHLIVIDGGADYIKSVNDEESATMIVEYFTHLAIKYNCAVIVVVHQNPGSDKERGHVGSQIQRKCFGMIGIKKDGDISIAEPKIMRKAGISDIQPLHYLYSKEKGYHIEIDAPEKGNTETKKLAKMEATINEALPLGLSCGYNDLVQRIIKAAKATSETTGKNYLKVGVANGWITKGNDGLYRAGAK